MKADYSAHREIRLLQQKGWRADNKALHSRRQAEYRATHKDAISAAKKVCYLAKIDEYRSKNTARRITEDPSRVKARHDAWRAANPDKVYAIHQRRRARKRNAEGTHTLQDITDIRRMQKNRCASCQVALGAKGGTVDHITPLRLGGSNDRRNLQLMCRPCNSRKNAKDPVVFARQSGLLI